MRDAGQAEPRRGTGGAAESHFSAAAPTRAMSLHVRPCLVHVCPVSSAQTEFLLPLNPFLCPTNQLRGSPVLPEQSVSIKELQGQLVQVARRHQEEAERFTDTIRQVNTDHGSAPPSLSAGPLERETERERERERTRGVL